ncbi:MAG TPA: DUF3025 domain-containing protein [Xanthomonadaceae bacterium]|nr:DUF3025 domain-containing protein [Xanthomonadaceae bacterium]
MRFQAPQRHQVEATVFRRPVYAPFARHSDLLERYAWPDCDDLNARLGGATHTITGRPLRFVLQSPELAQDALHYETRIHDHGLIATRAGNWHDLFNALVWIEYGAIKSAINARQAADVMRTGPAQRTRAQCALTHFDEAGAIVLLRDPPLLACWDAHDWHALFWQRRASLQHAIEVAVIGHALLEHALVPDQQLVGKCLAVASETLSMAQAVASVADGIASGALLRDPQELRPMPLSGLPGWHPENTREAFHREADSYRPLRQGRCYPEPLGLVPVARSE